MSNTIEINDAIIEVLCNYLTNNYSDDFTYEGFDNETIEIYAFSKKEAAEKYSIITIGVQHDLRQIYISKISMPSFLTYKGIGKTLIRIVYEIGLIYGYETFVVQLTDSFKEKLLRRGALSTSEYDTLQIIETTNLIDQ